MQFKPIAITKAFIVIISFILIGCDNNTPISQAETKAKNNTEKKTITVGFGPSTYIDQFEEGVKPTLEAQGYTVNIKVLSQNKMIPTALKEGEVDASVHISTANMIEVNKRINADMIVWADTASAPQSLRSVKHQSLDEVRDGMTIAVPNDPVNAERAVRILEELGWVEIAPNLEISTFHINEVKPKKYNLVLKEVESAQMIRILPDVDFAIINGNYVTNAKMKISDGLYVERSPPEHVVKVAIREINKGEKWALDLKAAYESKTFENYIKSKPLYEGYIFPAAWSKTP